MKEYEIEISRSQRNLDMDLPGDLVFGVPGPQGPQGPQGPEGKPGETPVRGVDYWMEEDKNEIKDYVDEIVLQSCTANLITSSASGDTIALQDSADAKLKGLTIYGKTTQNGTPTPEAPVELVNAGDDGSVDVSVFGKNIIDIYGFSATGIDTPNETRKLSNNYGTTISTIDPSERLVVSQTKTDQPTNPGSYRNGFFVVCLMNKLHAGDNISFSFDLDITDNPLNPDSITILPNGISGSYAHNICGNRWGGILKWEEYQERNYIEIRAMGLSGVFSNFQIELNDGCTEYEPYKSSQTLTVSTPNGLAGIPVTSGGNYTDNNGQQWICDEVDFARGVYVQRVGKIDSYNAESIPGAFMSSTGSLTTGATVIYALATPVETPLSAEELEAYASLHTNYPNTTIMNDGSAGMAVSYVADLKNYIDSRIAALSKAIVNS